MEIQANIKILRYNLMLLGIIKIKVKCYFIVLVMSLGSVYIFS